MSEGVRRTLGRRGDKVRTDLSGSDRTTLEELISGLEDALGTPRIGP